MSRQANSNLPRAISVADYILEDNGHSITEAAKEFKCSISTINRDINCLGAVAFYGTEPNEKELKIKYLKVQKILHKPTKQKNAKNTEKQIAKKATSN